MPAEASSQKTPVDKRFTGVSDVSAADTVVYGTSYVNLCRPVWVKAGRTRRIQEENFRVRENRFAIGKKLYVNLIAGEKPVIAS